MYEYATVSSSIYQMMNVSVFFTLAVMNNTTTNIHVQVLCEHGFPILLSIYLEFELLVIW